MSSYTCIYGGQCWHHERIVESSLLQHSTISATEKWKKKKIQWKWIIWALSYFQSWLMVLSTVAGRFFSFSLSFSRWVASFLRSLVYCVGRWHGNASRHFHRSRTASFFPLFFIWWWFIIEHQCCLWEKDPAFWLHALERARKLFELTVPAVMTDLVNSCW